MRAFSSAAIIGIAVLLLPSCALWRSRENNTIVCILFIGLLPISVPPLIEHSTWQFSPYPSFIVSFYHLWNWYDPKSKRLSKVYKISVRISRCHVFTDSFWAWSGLVALINSSDRYLESSEQKMQPMYVSSMLKSLRTSRTVAMVTVIHECHRQNSNTTLHWGHCSNPLVCPWVGERSCNPSHFHLEESPL